MKTTSPQFRAHLDSDVTALCTCWKIVRKDGVALRFTDADQDVTHESEVYQSIGAYSRSAIETTSSLSVDNLEVTGMSTELVLPVEELRAGAYDHAEVSVFMTSWLPSVGGTLKLRRGFFGEVIVYPNGTFSVELRGLLQRLSHPFTDVYSATCRHDLGDAGCKKDISHPFVTTGAHIPIPFRDPDFEEVGRVGMGASFTWYNSVNEENLIDTGDTYSGAYAARGSQFGGALVQDVDLTKMPAEFLSNIDQKQVTFTSHAWRKDNGDRGRIRYRFLDHDMRDLRASCGSYYINSRVNFPEVRFAGDFTFETWIKPEFGPTSASRNGTILNNDSEGSSSTTRRELRLSVSTPTSSSAGFSRIVYTAARLDAPGSAFVVLQADFPEPANVWAHVALTRRGDTFTIFVNGKERASTVFPQHGDFIASSFGQSGSLFRGELDEVRIWNTARTRAELNENRFRDLPGGGATGNSLKRYYPFDGDTNDYGADEAGALTLSANLRTALTPVRVAFRGASRTWSSGFNDVGTQWTLVSAENQQVPPYTRYVRVMFDHQSAAGTPQGTRMDSLFGWFQDFANTVPMPNFNVGDNGVVLRRAGMVTTGGAPRVFRAIIDDPRKEFDGWFQGGLVTFFSGKNAGSSMEVKRWTAATNQIELFLSMPHPIQQGDLFTIYPGCDKTRIGCAALFQNVINFFGTPDVPGEDDLFRYPDSK